MTIELQKAMQKRMPTSTHWLRWVWLKWIRKKFVLWGIGPCVLLITGVLLLIYCGFFWPTSVFASAYPIQGIDISNHQKEIDWNQVAQNEEIQFVFIKATEGKGYRDSYFATNWQGASQAGLMKGAYHYFTLTSSGEAQAKNFIGYVPLEKGCLPPVVDIEETGLDKEKFQKELKTYLTMVEEAYHQKPIIYVIYPLYDKYIKGDFEQYPIWVRDIVKPPSLSDERQWVFWQYSHRGRIEGIQTYVDQNVFHADAVILESMLSK